MNQKLVKIFLLLSIPVFLLSHLTIAASSSVEEIVFIVNAENPVKEISNQDLAEMFLKKKREWSDGTSVRFIDRKDESMERKIFLSHYLNKSDRTVELFWIGQKLYSGNAAPIQVLVDENVESMVSSFKGGISYVSSTRVLGKGVKKVIIQGSGVQ